MEEYESYDPLAATQPIAPKKKSKIWIGIVLAGLFVCVVCAGMLVFVTFFLNLDDEFVANVTVTEPTNLRVGDEGVIVIEVRNPTAKTILFDSVDIEHLYIDGFEILGATPAFEGDFSLKPILDQHSYTVKQPVPAEGKVTLEIRVRAVTAGSFSGFIDVCVGGQAICEGHILKTFIAAGG